MLIRRAQESDKDQIFRVHKLATLALCRNHYPLADIESGLGLYSPEVHLTSIITSYTLALEDAGKILAFGRLNDATMEVEALYVDPRAAGLGHGSRILRLLEKRAADLGAGMAVLYATLNAVTFYEKHGYHKLSDAVHTFPNHVQLACVYMEKRFYAESRVRSLEEEYSG